MIASVGSIEIWRVEVKVDMGKLAESRGILQADVGILEGYSEGTRPEVVHLNEANSVGRSD